MVYVHRLLEPVLLESFNSEYVTAVLGPRQVGKSTLLAAYKDKFNDRLWVVLNMDSLSLRQRCMTVGIEQIIQEEILVNIKMAAQKIWVIIDEAQKCPELFEQIKIIYDDFKHKNKIKFILTGSGSLSLHQLSAESLAGRVQIFYVREFWLKELLMLKHGIVMPESSVLSTIFTLSTNDNQALQQVSAHIKEQVLGIMPFKKLLQEALMDHYLWGGLPELILRKTDRDRLLYLENYLQTYLEHDVRAIQEIAQLDVYQKLMEILVAQTGSIRDDQKILDTLGCARETLRKYRSYLQATLLYEELYPFIGSTLKRLTKAPKGFILNNGLITYLTGIAKQEILIKTGLIGHRFENSCLQALMVNLDQTVGRNKLFYWRTSNGIEVDFVIDKKPVIFPIEVTNGSNKEAKKIKHLKYFLAQEERALLGLYIYNGEFVFDLEQKIWFLPLWML